MLRIKDGKIVENIKFVEVDRLYPNDKKEIRELKRLDRWIKRREFFKKMKKFIGN